MSSSTSRPTRAVRPSGKLNKDNIAELELPSHRKFVETAQAPALSSKLPSPEPTPSTINSESADVAWTPHSKPRPCNPGKRRPHVSNSSTSSDRHGYGIPGGYTDTGTTGTDTDSPFGTRGCTRTRIHGTHTRHGRFLVVLQQLTSNIIY